MSKEITDEQTTSKNTSLHNFDLHCIRPTIKDVNNESVSKIAKRYKHPKDNYNNDLKSDGFYVNVKHLTANNILGYFQDQEIKLNILKKFKTFNKLVEITFHDVQLEKTQVQTDCNLKITTISILLENKVICKTKYPFNRKVHKLLFQNKSLNYNDLLIQVNAHGGIYSRLPLYVPKVDEKNMKIEVQFGINDDFGNLFSGTIFYSVSSSNQEQYSEVEQTSYVYPVLNDPNDPSHNIFYFRPIQQIKKNIGYFLLEHFSLKLRETFRKENIHERNQSKSSQISVSESNMSLLGLRNFIQGKKPLELQEMSRSYINKKPVLSITILRGVEIPVREESATVEPLVEIQWGDTFRLTSPADGPAPVWHEILSFPVLKICDQKYIDIRLFDQHPIWGLQWLGECKIPIECYGEYEEFERWVDLSPLQSPYLTFGYVQASPGQSSTRISMLMKMENMNVDDEVDLRSIDKLCKKIQSCLAVPHKISEINNAKEASQLTMLLSSLSVHRGLVTPRQSLNLGKVDYYGRAALLTSLLQGLGQKAYVLLGSSQIRKWSAFTLTLNEDTNETIIWDPESGSCSELGESGNLLIKCFRLINHENIWENTQTTISPVDLNCNPKLNKDWRPLTFNIHFEDRPIQILELHTTHETQFSELQNQIEQQIKEKLCQLRKKLGVPTVFNRHASTILQEFLLKINSDSYVKFDKTELKPLYRAYYTHGIILKLRNMNTEDICKSLLSTKIHLSSGSVEYGLKCHLQYHLGNIYTIWLALVILKKRK
ncbi:uncharacterized protein LOC127287605 [Leptopilina boulardi]|uniref:uncharacterized protein LOC127287605 n=1 Tax=Leptopilina boulardi TaxID=63433 RepID=UPI0021F682E5|nr:uncharacterized protein LOC127287605 [Leptopilina boulardi]